MKTRWPNQVLVSCLLMGAVPLYAGSPSKASAGPPKEEKAGKDPHDLSNMVLVPGTGTNPKALFHMGNEKQGEPVAAFFMDRTGVTTDEYATCVSTGKCKPPQGDYRYCNYDPTKKQAKAGKGKHPMNCVTFAQAEAYCQAQGKRLPTEVEREYAARGVQGSAYAWGNDSPSDQNTCFSGDKTDREGTCSVASYPKTLLGQKNEAGIADLTGNLWEWTDSAYTDKNDQEVKYPKHLPCKEGNTCVLRGGSWYNRSPGSLRSSFRDDVIPAGWGYGVGFRCVRAE